MNVIETSKVEIVLGIIADFYKINLDNIIKLVKSHSYNNLNLPRVKSANVIKSGTMCLYADICVCPICKQKSLYGYNYCGNCGARFIKEEGGK